MSRPKGPLGIDPLEFSIALFVLLMLFVIYLLLPRAVRKQYFGAYPRRHAWSARSRMRRSTRGYAGVRPNFHCLENLLFVICVRCHWILVKDPANLDVLSVLS